MKKSVKVRSMFEIVPVRSGANSLRALEVNETFHPVLGPTAEATILHVTQQRLDERTRANPRTFVIWDVGLGAAGNAVTMLDAALNLAASFEIHSFDRTAAGLEFALQHWKDLRYLDSWRLEVARLISLGHVEVPHPLTGGVIPWRFHRGEFRDQLGRSDLPAPAAIMYDPYSPQRNPEMWSETHFTSLRRALTAETPCLLTSYSRSTAVRVTLLLAGFFVGRGRSIGDKDETTIAATDLGSLERPLESRWVDWLPASTNSGPLGDGGGERRAITVPELERVQSHPQFAK